jgi:hypothetical protein
MAFFYLSKNNSQIRDKKSNIFLIGATGIGTLLPLCRPFECLSLHAHQKVEEKLANVQKRAYLCGVKMKINEQLTVNN